MERTHYRDMQCPIARSLERVGEWWSILILRDAFHGLSRFDEFEKSLGIAPNMLTRRLNSLVEEGLLERRLYNEKPPRYEYKLTECGRDFRPVMLALLAWGNKHFAPEGISVLLMDEQTGQPVEPVMVDAHSGKRLDGRHYVLAAGPVAGEAVLKRLAVAAEKRALRAQQRGASSTPLTAMTDNQGATP